MAEFDTDTLWTARCEGCRKNFNLGELYRTRANPTQFKCATCCPPEDRFQPKVAVADSSHPASYAAEKLRGQIEKRLVAHKGYTTISVSIKDVLSVIEYLEVNERARLAEHEREQREEEDRPTK